MNRLKILQYPSSKLRRVAKPVKTFNEDLEDLIENMFDLLEKARGVGLAAPQVGIRKRLFIVSMSKFEGCFINPEIVWKSDEKESYLEGCLSLPGEKVVVERAKAITIKYQDHKFEERELKVRDELADIIQHEYDHLNGKLIVDYK